MLFILALIFAAVSAGSAIFNANTPVQLGPVPVLGGAALFVIFLVWAVARHLVWK